MKRTLSVFTLAMINVAAIGSVKNWPLTAEYGFASLFFFILSALIFFIPVALISAELATGWPHRGGIFVWVKEAFGHRAGFLAVWLLWIENVIWYPTVLSFIASTIAYIFKPELANNTLYNLLVILVLFWGATAANLLGMRVSGWISSLGVILGTFIPAAVIIGLGSLWFFSGNPSQIPFRVESFIPDMTSLNQFVFLTGVLLTLAGMEMSAVHARDVKNPQRDYPKAIFLSAFLILGLSMLGVMAICMVVPQAQISLTAGSMQAFSIFVAQYHLEWLTSWMATLIAFGAFASMSTWIVGPSKGLLAAAMYGDLPPFFRKVNKQGMPANLLLTQGGIVSFLSLIFLLMPSVNSAYWILVVLVAELYLVMYVMMFTAAIKLRYSKPNVLRAYRVPGRNWGIWTIGGLGIAGSLFAIVIGFVPPAQISTGSTLFYIAFLIIGMILTCLAPSLILRFKKAHWEKALPHEREMS